MPSGLQVTVDSPQATVPFVAGSDAKTAPDFSEFGLGLGAILQLRTVGLHESRYSTDLIGYVRGAWLIVRMPIQDDKLVILREGRPLSVRAFSGTDALSFRSDVISAHFAPTPHIFLQYPKFIETTRVRAHKRTNVRLVAAASKGNHTANLIVMDLSATGAQVSAPRRLGETGDRLSMAIALKSRGGIASLVIDVQVCSEKRDESTGRFIHGVQFQNLNPTHELALCGYLANLRTS